MWSMGGKKPISGFMVPMILLNCAVEKWPWKSLKWNLGISQLTLRVTAFQLVLSCPLDLFCTDGLVCATQVRANLINSIACRSKWEHVQCVGGCTVCLSICCKVFNPSDGQESVSRIDSIHTNTPFKSFLQQTTYTTQNQSPDNLQLSSRIVNVLKYFETSVIDPKVLTEITHYPRENTVNDTVVYNTR